MSDRLLVVGNGMASLRLLERLPPGRFQVTVVGAEPAPAYNRVLLSSLLAGEVDERDCALRERSWYLRQGIRLITGTPATSLDAEARTVQAGAETLAFDRLVLATGSTPVRPPIPGIELSGVVTFRDLADVAAMQALEPGRRAVVIGGGLLGLEAASGLARRGIRVDLVHLMDRPMERQLDARGGALVASAMRRLGITLHLDARTLAIEGTARADALRLADGTVLPADLVVVAIGVRPNADLAHTAGLAVGRGILVNDRLESSVPGIHAIGECAEHRGQAYGLVEPACAQAEVLARRLAGAGDLYEGTPLATTLKVSGVAVVSAGRVVEEGGDTIVLSDPAAGIYRKLVVEDGRLVGALLVGDATHGRRYIELIRSGEPIDACRHTLMFAPPSDGGEAREAA